MISKTGFAKLCCVYSGVAFGIYWIPIRALEGAGFNGIWAVFVFSLLPIVFLLPLIIWRWRIFVPGRLRFHVCSAMAGIGFSLYVGAYLYTEVIHAIVLFYLMPIWGFVIARVLIKERITPVRWLSMALALIGLAIMYSFESGLPIPKNLGDWMALVSGVMWAGVALMLLTDNQEDPVNYALGFITWSAVASFVIAYFSSLTGVVASPVWSNLYSEMFWLIPFSLLVLIPVAYATMYGPSQVNPGIAGLLFMTEISVGTITAALLAGEPFGIREICGVVLITLAGIAEPLRLLWNDQGKTGLRQVKVGSPP